MGKKCYGTGRKRKPGVGRPHACVAPLLAMAVPAVLTRGKATAIGGIGAAANYGTHKALDSLSKRKRTYKKRRTPKVR